MYDTQSGTRASIIVYTKTITVMHGFQITYYGISHTLYTMASYRTEHSSSSGSHLISPSFFPGGVGVAKVVLRPVTNVQGPEMASARHMLTRLPLISRPHATKIVPFGCCHGDGLSQLSFGNDPELFKGDHGPRIDLEI